MTTQRTVNATGSFDLDVTLTLGLLTGLDIDATFSADYKIIAEDLTRTDWIYWETSVIDTYDYGPDLMTMTLVSSESVNNYREHGHGQSVTTTTYTVSGNLDDGFDETLTIEQKQTGAVTFQGTRNDGSPAPESPVPQVTTTTETWHYGGPAVAEAPTNSATAAFGQQAPAQPDPGTDRPLTQQEAAFIRHIFLTLFDGLAGREGGRDTINVVLGGVRLHDAGNQTAWYWYKNIIAQNTFYRNPNPIGVTLGLHQFYRAGHMPQPNSLRDIDLVTHETVHSLQEQLVPLGTPLFITAYLTHSLEAALDGRDSYEANLFEVMGHAVQYAVIDALKKYPTAFDSFDPNSPTYGQLPVGFDAYLEQEYLKWFRHFLDL